MSGWASQVQGISTDIANSATDTADKLIEAQKSYEDRIADIQKTRSEGLTNAEGKYELGMSFSDRLIQQQSERDAQIKIEKDYKESMAEAEKDLAKEKATIEADRVKAEKGSKDAELKIIADFQKSKLSALDQEKIDVNDNYTELKKLYEKYGYDTVQLEKDRQKALKDIKVQGYVDDLDKLSGWVTDTKTILSGVKDAWDTLKWAKEKYDQLTVKKPTTDYSGGATSSIPGGLTSNDNSVKSGMSALTTYLPVIAVGIKWLSDYQTGKALDAAKLKATTEYADSLRGLVKNNQLTAEKANYQFIERQHEKDKTFKKGMIINGKYKTYQEIEDYLAYTKEKFPSITQAGGNVLTTSGAIRGASPATTTANQAPSSTLNDSFNLAPSRNMMSNDLNSLSDKYQTDIVEAEKNRQRTFKELDVTSIQRERIRESKTYVSDLQNTIGRENPERLSDSYRQPANKTIETVPVTTVRQQPTANININFDLSPSQQQIDEITRSVELSARKQGFRVRVGRNA
jgi:hypothetical protein